MNKKGFSLIELLGCLIILGIILCIGLYSTRGTLATTLSTLTNVSENEIYEIAETYTIEKNVTWFNDDLEYTCITVSDLVDNGYFKENEVTTYKDKVIKIIRNPITKVVTDINLLKECN